MFNEEGFEILQKTIQNSSFANEVPVASVMQVEGKFFTPFTNQVYKNKNHLHHAEVLAISHTLKELDEIDFKNHNATLFCTLEPCCMCLSFASLVKISKVICYAYDFKFGGSGRIFTNNSAFQKPEIIFIEKQEIKTLMKNFFLNKR